MSLQFSIVGPLLLLVTVVFRSFQGLSIRIDLAMSVQDARLRPGRIGLTFIKISRGLSHVNYGRALEPVVGPHQLVAVRAIGFDPGQHH